MHVTVAQETDPASSRTLLESLTARLPQWFGQPDSNLHYAEQAERLENRVARIDGQSAGLLLLERHSPASAEIYWLGVDPDHHRRGIGRALIESVERHLRDEKARFLFVTTLHPEVDHEPYQRTRAFYERLGFAFVLPADQGPLGPSRDRLAWYLKAL
jgi:ribosomal protein S18 acetylase RimI-like enzyme